MTRLVLVRHGESVVSVSRVIGGYRTCTGLTPLGRKQAEALAARLTRTGELSIDVLIASNFARARETAEILAPALGDLEIETIDDFGEHDPGPDVDGMTYQDFVDRFGRVDWPNLDRYDVGFPG